MLSLFCWGVLGCHVLVTLGLGLVTNPNVSCFKLWRLDRGPVYAVSSTGSFELTPLWNVSISAGLRVLRQHQKLAVQQEASVITLFWHCCSDISRWSEDVRIGQFLTQNYANYTPSHSCLLQLSITISKLQLALIAKTSITITRLLLMLRIWINS